MRFAGMNNPGWGGATARACAAALALASVVLLLDALAWSQPQAAQSKSVGTPKDDLKHKRRQKGATKQPLKASWNRR